MLRALAFMTVASLASAAEPSAVCRVALVIDDGPVPEHAQAFLDLLAEQDLHVTFAYVAQTAKAHPEVARTVLAAGHEIANHSFSHQHPDPLDDAALTREIVEGQRVLTEVFGIAPRWYWPPFLETDDRMPALFAKAGLARYVPRNFVSSDDWNREVGADEIERRATTNVTDGTVLLFHEWREETLERMPAILAELKRQGCEFHTFSELAEELRSSAGG